MTQGERSVSVEADVFCWLKSCSEAGKTGVGENLRRGKPTSGETGVWENRRRGKPAFGKKSAAGSEAKPL